MSSSSERIAVEKNVGHRKDDMSGGGLRLDIPSSNQAPADTVASSMTPNRNQLQDTSSAGTGEGGLDYAFSNSSTHPIRQSTMPTQLRRIVTPVRSATGSVWVTHTDNAHELAPPYYYPVVPATSPQMNYEEWCAAAADLNPVALSAAASPAMMSSVADQQDVGQQVDSHVGCIDPALIAQDRVGGASLEQANCSSSYGDRPLPHVGAPSSPVVIESASANPLFNATRSLPISSVGGVRPKPSRGTCHFGEKCGKPLHDCSTRGVKEHFLLFHKHELEYYTYEGKEVVDCPWYEEGKPCAQTLARDGLYKHIATRHLRSAESSCPYCRNKISRSDAMLRHFRRDCKLIPADIKHKEEEDWAPGGC
ncbi:uncharacterized protein B0H18DRAFT_1119415 [Fomitopsis serialis]|uniref:uncharacterized protein n=1 Tax=Fomitopsis serialis TaxID=139415 RepID=UPI00200769B0|nr:uncharacterized protein B0H18DRAFT_1119415 [Neoantrodia serialis]KAH9925576.1 hypothetical protein B0H18DRAFT_1119415 [Neoantrodia serialis]